MIWSAGILVVLAFLHSLLGEKDLVQPLLARDWEIDIPRPAADRLIRFAWHLPSIAWLGLAGCVWGLPAIQCAAWVCALTALLILVMLPGHFAWAAMLAAAIVIWEQIGGEPALLQKWLGLGLGVSIALGAAGLHFYWALGGRRGLDVAVPQKKEGGPAFSPGPWLCALVGVVLVAFAGLMLLHAKSQAVHAPDSAGRWIAWLLWGAFAFLVLRALGDGRQVGFTKQDRSSEFAQWDDALFTPLVVGLALGALASLGLS